MFQLASMIAAIRLEDENLTETFVPKTEGLLLKLLSLS